MRWPISRLAACGQRGDTAQRAPAVAPGTGERFFLELPYLNAEGFQILADAFAAAFPTA